MNPGDIIIGDTNGLTVVRLDFAEDILSVPSYSVTRWSGMSQTSNAVYSPTNG